MVRAESGPAFRGRRGRDGWAHLSHVGRLRWHLLQKESFCAPTLPTPAWPKTGAPVTLEGVTIGNVARMTVVPGHNPNPVEVTMSVGQDYRRDLHTDSVATIAQAGVLGDSFVDIDSTLASGPEPPMDGVSVLPSSGAPTVCRT